MKIKLKAISLWQPYASAIERGWKTNETRGWSTDYRGELVICSAKRKLSEAEIKATNETAFNLWKEGLPYGFALCVVELYDVVPSSAFHGATPLPCSQREADLGDYTPGRFVWRTRNCRKLISPLPVTGRQGFFTVELDARDF